MQQMLLSKAGLVMLGFLAVAGYFLWTEHQVHTIGVLPWVLLGGCVVVHLFMHGGHGGHGGGGAGAGPGVDEANSDNRREP